MQPVYLDFAASTPVDPRAADAVLRALSVTGNPSSVHAQGRAVRAVVEGAREQVARLVDAPASAITFTSGATEANALAIRGVIAAARRTHPAIRPRVLASPVEHSSVIAALHALDKAGDIDLVWLPVDANGVVDPEAVRSALSPDVTLVVMQWVNNVTGVLQPVAEIGALVVAERARRAKGTLPIAFLCDAVQAARTQELRPFAVGVDLLTLSSHKIYGPKGVGALVRRPGLVLDPVAVGGGQEDGLRAGTENVPGIAGFGAAAEILTQEKEKDVAHVTALRSVVEERLRAFVALSSPAVPDVVFLAGKGVDERAVFELDARGFAVSSGSACDAGSRKASHVLAAMGRTGSGVRVSFGRGVAVTDASAFADAFLEVSRRA